MTDMNLERSMRLAGQNLLNCLCPTRNYQPYWSMRVGEDCRAEMVWAGNIHNLGRWWDAMLRLERAVGFVIRSDIEAAMLANLHESFDNPDNLCLPNPRVKYLKPALDFHSLRESLLALNALVRYRSSTWAAAQGHRMLETLRRITRTDCSWDFAQLDYYDPARDAGVVAAANVSTNGRLIEALVWFFEATGDNLAIELADIYARYHLQHSTAADGTFNDSSKATHTHSYLGTLRGLLLFGILTGQQSYIQRVLATYRTTVPRLVLESGFACHDLWKDNPDRGETGSSGDAMQLALWLGIHAGYTEVLDDAERILRARIVPAQIVESPRLLPAASDDLDEHARLNERIVGGIGGMHKHPHAGKKNTTDVTAAGLHGLVDVYEHVVTDTAATPAGSAGIRINFHLDFEDRRVCVASARTDVARLTVTVKQRLPVLMRLPSWAPEKSIRLSVDGKELAVGPSRIGSFVHVSGHLMPGHILLSFALPERTSVEKVGDLELSYRWRGDEIVGVCPNNDFFPMYPTAEGCAQETPYRPASPNT